MIKVNYDDCPYNCNNGKIFDYGLRKLIPCPHCSEKRESLAKEGLAENEQGDIEPLYRLLGVNNKYLEAKFVYEAVVPEAERLFIEDESLKKQGDLLEEVYLGLSVGELPDKSYCIGLGNKGRVDRLAYPMLAKAYLSGLSVARFISCTEYNRLYVAMSSEVESYLDKDFVMVMIQDGASKADILSAKGLMQSRALKGKGTVFVTTWSIEACSTLLGYFGEETFFLASGSFVEYKVSKKKKHSAYINQLTGVENELFIEDDDKDLSSNSNKFKGSNMVTMEDLLK